MVKKIGISIYEFSMFEKINKNFRIDMIQIPLNILDRRINLKKISKIAKKEKIELHVRSIFLQGILLKEKIKFHLTLINGAKFYLNGINGV